MERDECSLVHARHLLAVHLEADWRPGEEYHRITVSSSCD